MTNFLLQVEKILSVVSRLFVYVASLFLACLIVILVFSAISRYFIGRPFAATEEISTFLFVVISIMPIAFTFFDNKHIRIVALWQHLSQPWRDVASLCGQLLAIVVLGFIISETWSFAAFSFSIGARAENTDMLQGPWMMVIPTALGLIALGIGVRALLNLAGLLRRETWAPVRFNPTQGKQE